ncbi:MAG: metallophosphoesterase [Planctomycetes bacterium]|nr:metallophosphoesterase [Planctomycetota bacterium]
MKPLATSISVVLILAVVASFSVTGAISYNRSVEDEISIAVEKRNPWTSLDLNNKAEDFQFVIVTDRTGGRRPGGFTQAVEKINLLQPEFVMSVGDLIKGYTEDPGMWALEWAEFESKIAELQMPFFFCAGNHDISNLPMSKEWQRKFGSSYYHFKYRNVLFLVLNTEEVRPKSQDYLIGKQQQKWAAEVLQNNQDVRWTFVILHKPTWTYPTGQRKWSWEILTYGS